MTKGYVIVGPVFLRDVIGAQGNITGLTVSCHIQHSFIKAPAYTTCHQPRTLSCCKWECPTAKHQCTSCIIVILPNWSRDVTVMIARHRQNLKQTWIITLAVVPKPKRTWEIPHFPMTTIGLCNVDVMLWIDVIHRRKLICRNNWIHTPNL